MTKQTSLQIAIADFIEAGSDGDQVIAAYAKHEKAIQSYTAFTDSEEFNWYAKFCINASASHMNSNQYKKAKHILKMLLKRLIEAPYDDLQLAKKHCLHYLGLCCLQTRDYAFGATTLESNLSGSLRTDSELREVLNNLKIARLMYKEKVITVILLMVLVVPHLFHIASKGLFFISAVILLIISSVYFSYRYIVNCKLKLKWVIQRPLLTLLMTMGVVITVAYVVAPHKILTHIGDAFRDAGAYDPANVFYLSAIDKNSTYSTAHNNRGVLLFKRKDLPESVTEYDKAIALNKSAVSYKNRALAKFVVGDYDGGVADITVASSLSEKTSMSSLCLSLEGACNEKIGESCRSLQRLHDSGVCK